MITEFMDNSRFKFRVYFKGSEYAKSGYEDLCREDVIYSLRPDGQVIRTVIYECQQEGHEGSPCPMQFTPNNDLYDIQFCTGLKDKNGKLIYEGDIVKYLDYICEIAYKRGSFILEVRKGKKDGFFHFYDMHNSFLDVIGNIYEDSHLIENPELLKECEDE